MKGLYLFDSYMGPLLGSTTPQVWGFSAPRPFGLMVFSFGNTLAGLRPGAAEMLQLLPTEGPSTTTWNQPALTPTSCSDAVGWWAARLNDLFGVLTDPVLFSDRGGRYSAATHHQTLMTLEQLFERTTSLLCSHRDVHARRVLLFTVLDTVERLTGWNLETLCSLPFAEKTLDNLRADTPTAVIPLLLPTAERSVAALRELQSGFFLSPTGPNAPSAAVAAPRYVKILRNATHGHGSNRASRADETAALLAQHDGDIPPDLPLLAFLYLLAILQRPENVRKALAGRAAR